MCLCECMFVCVLVCVCTHGCMCAYMDVCVHECPRMLRKDGVLSVGGLISFNPEKET